MKKLNLLLIIGLFYSLGQAQNNKKELENFELNIQTSDEEIILESKNGSAWRKLTFSKTDKAQAVDEYGMTEISNDKNKRQKSEKGLANYTFTIKQENGEIILDGIEGTAWTKLTFKCKNVECATDLNEMGMM